MSPREIICDPACGTGGFLFTAHNYIELHHADLTRDEKAFKVGAFRNWELVKATARLCATTTGRRKVGRPKGT